MGANNWMLDLVLRLLAEVEAHRGGTVFLVTRRVAAVRPPGAVYCSQPVEHPLHAVRRCLIREILIVQNRGYGVSRRFYRIEERAERRALELSDSAMLATAEIACLF